MRTQQYPGSGWSLGDRPPAGLTPSRSPARKSRFIAQTSDRCSSASRWKGQLREHDVSARDGSRLVPVLAERTEYGTLVIPGRPRLGADLATGGVGDRREAVDHGLPALGGVSHGGGEKRSGEVVVPFRDGRGEVDLAGSVELRRPPGPGARPPGEALEADLDHPRLHELVEVEGRHGSTHTERGGRLVS